MALSRRVTNMEGRVDEAVKSIILQDTVTEVFVYFYDSQKMPSSYNEWTEDRRSNISLFLSK